MSVPPSMPGAIALNDPPMMGPPPGMPGPGEPPSMDQAADLLRKATASSSPVIDPSPVTTVELPGGWISPAGVLVKTAEVKELNGFAEERLSRLDMNKNVASYVTELLLLGVVHIGDETPTRDLMKNLLIGDRDFLVLAIRQATYGNDVEFKLNCTACGEESDIRVEIDKDVEVVSMEDPLTRVFDVELRNGAAKVTLLTGVAQEAFSENIGKKTQAEINTTMLSKSVVEINGVPVRGKDNPVRALSAADRATITDFIADHQPGPQFKEIPVPCATCGEEYPISLGIPNLFRF